MSAPVINTERLVLRSYTPDDLSDCAAMWADPVVVRFIGGATQPRDRVWTKLLAYIGHWHAIGYGFWCVRERGTDRYVGEAGLADFRRTITPSFEGTPEAGWALAAWAHGKGMATEAMRAVLAWSDTQLKLGYRSWAESTFQGTPIRVYERLA